MGSRSYSSAYTCAVNKRLLSGVNPDTGGRRPLDSAERVTEAKRLFYHDKTILNTDSKLTHTYTYLREVFHWVDVLVLF